MKTTAWLVAAASATALSGCMVMLPMPPPPPPPFPPPFPPSFAEGPGPGLLRSLHEACIGQPEGARMPLPGRHSEVLIGVCARGPDGHAMLRPESPPPSMAPGR